jgi:hypothetical protein
MKKAGTLRVIIASTYWLSPARGPESGGLLTVTVVFAVPVVNPFRPASARASERATEIVEFLFNSKTAVIAAASAAV